MDNLKENLKKTKLQACLDALAFGYKRLNLMISLKRLNVDPKKITSLKDLPTPDRWDSL